MKTSHWDYCLNISAIFECGIGECSRIRVRHLRWGLRRLQPRPTSIGRVILKTDTAWSLWKKHRWSTATTSLTDVALKLDEENLTFHDHNDNTVNIAHIEGTITFETKKWLHKKKICYKSYYNRYIQSLHEWPLSQTAIDLVLSLGPLIFSENESGVKTPSTKPRFTFYVIHPNVRICAETTTTMNGDQLFPFPIITIITPWHMDLTAYY